MAIIYDLATEYFTDRKKGDKRLAGFFVILLSVSLTLSSFVDLNPQAIRTNTVRTIKCAGRVIRMNSKTEVSKAS